MCVVVHFQGSAHTALMGWWPVSPVGTRASREDSQFRRRGHDSEYYYYYYYFKAEHVVTAQPGAALKDIVSYGNQHGMAFQFFRVSASPFEYEHNRFTSCASSLDGRHWLLLHP